MKNSEIDKLIAEKVMGWNWEKDHVGYGWRNERGLFSAREGCWTPSTRISDAWSVVDKFEKADIRITKNYRGLHSAEIHYYDGDIMIQFTAKAKTAPMAICLMALKTVGISIEEANGFEDMCLRSKLRI